MRLCSWGKYCPFENIIVNQFFLFIAAAAIISLSHETYILVNSSVVLGCVAHGNPPPLGIMWRTTSSHYTITELSNFTTERVVDDFTVISNLTLSFVALESRGEYTCVAYNEIQMTQVSDEEAVGLFVVGMCT